MSEPDVLYLVEPEIGGGEIKKARIDEITHSSLTKLKITGLTQETFDYFVVAYGNRFEEIDLFKCPRITDLSGLSTLQSIKSISIYWNQRTTRLWDMSANKGLKKLTFRDFTKLTSIDDLSTSSALEDVEFGNAVWPKMVIESLQPLANIESLRSLMFNPKKIADGRVEPLTEIANLEELDFPTNMFSTEQVAWLAAKLGSTVRSRVLRAVNTLERPIDSKGKKLDSLVIGKRKPLLDSKLDKTKLEKYISKFDELVSNYRQNPAEREPI